MFWRRRRERELADAREEALRWYDRLGGQIANLPPGNDPATKQAMVDAGERYNAAGAQLDRADSPKQYELARETALEGLNYIRAARVAMGSWIQSGNVKCTRVTNGSRPWARIAARTAR